MTGSDVPPSFRLAYVPGVTPTKWVRIWNERLPGVPLALVGVPADEAADALRRGDADAGLLRLPVDRTDLSAIPLYTETTVVVIPKDHAGAAVEELSVEDLADEVVLHPLDDTLGWERPPGRPAFERPATTADAVELVAAGVGLLVVPQSLARLHHRKDLTYRPLTAPEAADGASGLPESRVALSWPEARTTDLVEEFIGIVRGRTVNSTRGPRKPPAEQKKTAGRPERKGGGAPRKPSGGKGGSASRGGARSGSGKNGGRGGKPRRRG
ncbi:MULTISPECIES: LysR family substrate-binding domain-containing protein [unclassified Streptomyces]|uniref:LysR family substrate-binding domain-containing protein n=2 Tax=Streptomyces TaxID=1883 RepID=A0ABU2RRG1_9ACTN|nr:MULTISPECIES: LysR family substrate-binding domain-containing protein [unclassified Streptomyces]MYR69085.1 LysR family transcriptional regulator [Streptomyces sp. SID4939]MYS03045.1 LysR family transcriptional regulator [Streptomyces sp. SID4940]MYT63995.1 LysR family transcriptional regulator [Streptomyces sp. SID8357]MYT89273.1 LysR family transcriptional regulator [Streptomyces sp. SID8360]MYU31945.1 LysR family transcriptional regulator [Streptomyces sp. SID8358]MYW36406.1 LysR family